MGSKSIVMPGAAVQGQHPRPGHVHMENGAAYSSVLGTFDADNGFLQRLEGPWLPKQGDAVVGVVSEARGGSYSLRLFHHSRCIMPKEDGRQQLAVGDLVEASVRDVERDGTVVASQPFVLAGGFVLDVKPSKVSRIMGKDNSMADQIEELTGVRMIVGDNGLVWLSSFSHDAVDAIRMVERNAHASGLTDGVRRMLLGRRHADPLQASGDVSTGVM